MPAIPLPTGIKGDSSTPKQKEVLVNLYYERGQTPTLSPRPGIIDKGEIYGRCRGQCSFNGALYRVAADKLFKLTLNALGDIVYLDLGATITGINDCVMTASFTHLMIAVKGGAAYAVDTSDTVSTIVDPNFKPSRDIEFTEGLFVSVPDDGGPIQWSDLGDPMVWPSGNFSDAEVLPDKNNTIIANKGTLLVGGDSSIEELTYDSQRNVFVNVSGAAINHGTVSNFARYGETIVYLGKYENGGISVFQYGSGDPISSKGVDEELNKYTASQLSDVWVDSFSWRGQNFVVWRLIDSSLCFYGDFGWFKSGVSGDYSGKWLGQYIASLNGKLICGDSTSNKVGELADISSDYGEKIESFVRTYIRGEPRSRFLVKRVFCACTTGQSNDLKEIGLSVSEDGVHGYNNIVWTSLGVAGVYNNEVSWGQIGRFDNFCGIQLTWKTDIKVPIDGVYFE